MFHWQTTRISFFRGEYHLFLLLTIFAQLGATAQSACGQQAKLEWHDADKVDRLELEDLYESYLSRIHALERFECHYTIDRSDDVGANGARIEAYSQLIADDGKGSGRFISRREDIDRQLGTITLSGNSSSQTSFFIDMLKKNEKVYRWGGDQSYELTKTTLDSQRSSFLIIHPHLVALSGGRVDNCTSLESYSFESSFSTKVLTATASKDGSSYFRFDPKNKDDLAKQGLAGYVMFEWKDELPIKMLGMFGKIGNLGVVNSIETSWGKISKHDVPTKIVKESNQGKSLMTIECKWEFGNKVPESRFNLKDLGSLSLMVEDSASSIPKSAK